MAENGGRDFLTTIDGVGETVATALLERFGSVEAVLDAEPSELRAISGVGATTVENIRREAQRAGGQGSSTRDAGMPPKQALTRVDGVGEAVATRLLGRFGSATAVFRASERELTQVDGVGSAVAGRLASASLDGPGVASVSTSTESSRSATEQVLDELDDFTTGASGETERGDGDDGFAVQNMVLSGDLGVELLLDAVAIDMASAAVSEGERAGDRLVYDPGSEGTVRVTERGKLLVAGVSSEAAADELLASFLDALPPVGIDDEDIELTVTNVVATATVDNPVPPTGLAIELEGDDADYDPSGFPGYSFTLPDSGCTFTLFGSGKVTITGADSIEAAEAALETLNATLDELDSEALRPSNDAVHERIDVVAEELAVGDDSVARAHELVDEYDAVVPGNARGDDGKAAMALFLASESLTQSAVADTAGVSTVTIRNISREFREATDRDARSR